MNDDQLVKQMRDYVTEKNLRKYELARLLGTTEANVSRWLSGKTKISKAWAELIRQRLV